jgi:hypothetical protein
VRDHFHAIASGDDHGFFNAWVGVEIAAAIGQLRLRNRKPFSHFERCALMIHADELISHAANL